MEKMYSIANSKVLNLGNTYTYTVLAADRKAYSGFFLTVGATVTVSDGTNSVILTVAANENIPLNNSMETIVGTVDNVLVWTF